MQIGIIGLPNVGKSTLFNALLKKQVALAANYPFATIEPNVGIVDVPDQRFEKLVEMVHPEKNVPAIVKFVDIAGLVKGASEGEGLGNQFLSHVREVDALVHVIRDFEDEDVARAGSVDPENDKEVIETELMLSDLQAIEKRIEKEQKFARSGDKDSRERLAVFDKLYKALSEGELASTVTLDENESKLAKEANLLTLKPMIYVFNVSEKAFTEGENDKMGNDNIRLSAKLEEQISQLTEEEQEEYLTELGIHASGLDRVIKRGYDILGLHTFFTQGPKEVHAWTIEKGAKAPQAAGKIHTDFERGFIAAEVISFKDFVECNGKQTAKEKGLLRTEGKNYVVQDGDIIEFRFSV